MSERIRRGFQSAFEKRNGGIKVMKIKNDRPDDPNDDAPTSLPKKKHRRADKKHTHGRDFRPVNPKKKQQQSIKPSIPISYGTDDTSFKSVKEWDLDDREHTFSPHNAVHYLLLASLPDDIPVLYNDFTEVPTELNLK